MRFDQQDITLANNVIPDYVTVTSPVWTEPVVDSYLRLDGIVSILEIGGSITLTLTGSLSGADDLVISVWTCPLF